MTFVTSATAYVVRERCSIHRASVFKLLIAGVAALGVSSLIPQMASAQTNTNSHSVRGVGSNLNYRGGTRIDQNGVGSNLNYPGGTRIDQNGAISTPNGSVIYPASTVNNGNGLTTYYYQDGTHVTTQNNTVSPTGTFLTPGLNGGLTISPNVPTPTPNLNGGFRTISPNIPTPTPNLNGGFRTINPNETFPNPGWNGGFKR